MNTLLRRMAAAEAIDGNLPEMDDETQKRNLAGSKALFLVQKAANSTVKIGPEERIGLLRQALAMARRFQPPNWGDTDEERTRHCDNLERWIEACRQAWTNTTHIQGLQLLIKSVWDPLSEFSPVLTEKKGARVFKMVCTRRFWALATGTAIVPGATNNE